MRDVVKILTPHKYFVDNSDDWLQPAYPDWYKKLKLDKATGIETEVSTSRECPAFVHLFKNSHLVRSPMDISFHITSGGEFGWKVSQQSDFPFVKISGFNFGLQMGKEWENSLSIKIDFSCKFIPEQDTQCMFFDPMYHLEGEKTGLSAMTGVWPMYPTLHTMLGVNMMIDVSKVINNYIHIEQGTPLAYLYWPAGKPKIEFDLCSDDEWIKNQYVHTSFKGDFVKKEQRLKKMKEQE